MVTALVSGQGGRAGRVYVSERVARERLVAAVDAEFDRIQGRRATYRFAGAARDEAPPFISSGSQPPMRATAGEAPSARGCLPRVVEYLLCSVTSAAMQPAIAGREPVRAKFARLLRNPLERVDVSGFPQRVDVWLPVPGVVLWKRGAFCNR